MLCSPLGVSASLYFLTVSSLYPISVVFQVSARSDAPGLAGAIFKNRILAGRMGGFEPVDPNFLFLKGSIRVTLDREP
jgi:hypothetical protein